MTSEPTLAEVTDLLRALGDRLESIEDRLSELEAAREIPEEDLLAISAAVAAFLGHRAKIRAIHFSRPGAWAHHGRQAVQSRAVSPLR